MSFLPLERVDDYLTNVIKIPDWRLLMARNMLEFLTVFQRQTFLHIYFQNIRMVSTEIYNRRAPTLAEIIETGFSGEGGICNEINIFNTLILLSLEFDAYNISGTVHGGENHQEILNCHVMTIVRFSMGQLFLIDTASGNPLKVPVPMHSLPHCEQVGGYRYEFREIGDGHYMKFHCAAGFTLGDLAGGLAELPRFYFTLEERTFQDFQVPMTRIFTDRRDTAFLDAPFLFRCTLFTENECEFVLVRRRKIMFGSAHSKTVDFYTKEDAIHMKSEVRKLFPKLDQQQVDLAWNVFHFMEPKTINAWDLIF